MSVLFDNPAGLWALAALPAIIAIHFLRPAARRERASTLFLLEHLEPGVARARRLRRLRTTAAFWLQLLAALLLAWLLAEPRWLRDGSRQTVAVVLDCSASMRPFRAEAAKAVALELERWAGAASQTTWLVRESDSRRAPLYQGNSSAAAQAALGRWHPDLGAHDVEATLRELQFSVGANAPVIFVTDHRVVPPTGVTVLGVGRPLANTGFVGASVEELPTGAGWRALVQQRGAATSSVGLRVLDSAGRELAPPQTIALTDGGVLSVEGRFPEGVDALTLVLPADAFDLDDRLPLLRPRPRLLQWAIAADAPPLFRKFTAMLEAAKASLQAPDVRFTTASAGAIPASAGWSVVALRSETGAASPQAMAAPVFAERDSLVEGLVWEGFLSAGPGGLRPSADATVLLWQGGRELAWVEGSSGARRLVFNCDLARSNAERLPAFVVLLERFVAEARGDLRLPSAENFETHQRIEVGRGWQRPGDVLVRDGAGSSNGPLFAPAEPGFFSVSCGGADVLRGAARFGDSREADFRAAENFVVEGRSVAEAKRAASLPDPWRPVWLLAVAGCLGGAWWVSRRAGNAERRTSNAEHRTADA